MFFGRKSAFDRNWNGSKDENKCEIQVPHECSSEDSRLFIWSRNIHCNVVHNPVEKESVWKQVKPNLCFENILRIFWECFLHSVMKWAWFPSQGVCLWGLGWQTYRENLLVRPWNGCVLIPPSSGSEWDIESKNEGEWDHVHESRTH